ncbi:MAG TPA: BON domain-containing protein [Actinomycetota bacterium]|nr:BON domain-containing protein [Actinomycetota bacterium]
MRTRTLVIAGTGAAAVAYLLDPQGGKARRDRIRASIRPVTRGRTVPVEPISAPILEPPREDPIPLSAKAPFREEPVSVASPSADVDDATIVRSVRTKLQERRDLRTDDLVVDVVNGVAYLSGGLRDRWTFGEIIDLTAEVPGVRRVQSLLHLPHSETISMTISDRRTDEDRRA